MALAVGIVGLAGSGKTTLFNVLTHAGASAHERKEHVGMAPIADERLTLLAPIENARKVTPATIRVIDVPGTGAQLLGNLRQVDALLAVTREPDDLETLKLELLVADRDHVERRLERVRTQAKSGDAQLRAEVGALERLLAHVEGGGSIADYAEPLPPNLEALTTKPIVELRNTADAIDLALEAELAELPDDEAAQFRDGPSPLEEITRRLTEALGLITFFTIGDTEARAWTLRDGQTALEAAETIHSDIARGFIRCEVIHWRDLIDAGSRAEVSRRGQQRLEGKEYVVQDGDVLNIRFNV